MKQPKSIQILLAPSERIGVVIGAALTPGERILSSAFCSTSGGIPAGSSTPPLGSSLPSRPPAATKVMAVSQDLHSSEICLGAVDCRIREYFGGEQHKICQMSLRVLLQMHQVSTHIRFCPL